MNTPASERYGAKASSAMSVPAGRPMVGMGSPVRFRRGAPHPGWPASLLGSLVISVGITGCKAECDDELSCRPAHDWAGDGWIRYGRRGRPGCCPGDVGLFSPTTRCATGPVVTRLAP